MVSSMLPRLEAKWPPVLLTELTRKSRSSRASCGSLLRSRVLRSAGLCMVSSSVVMILLLLWSERAGHDVVGQLFQAVGTVAKRRQRGQRVVVQVAGKLFGLAQAHQAYISRLVVGRILAGGLAQRGGIGFAVQHVVHHLEGQAHALGKVVEAVLFGVAHRLAAVSAQQYGGADQRT